MTSIAETMVLGVEAISFPVAQRREVEAQVPKMFKRHFVRPVLLVIEALAVLSHVDVPVRIPAAVRFGDLVPIQMIPKSAAPQCMQV